MKIRVLLFGSEAQLAGTRAVTVSVDGAPTCATVLRELGRACPALETRLASARLAVNHAFAKPEDSIREGDEVALIGVVSGG